MTTRRILENSRLLWLNTNTKEDDDVDTQVTLKQLRMVVNHVDVFTQIDNCIHCLNEAKNEKVLIIASGSPRQHFVKQIQSFPQVDAIYIFCNNPDRYKSWTGKWSKIRGVYSCIEAICDAIRTAVKQTNDDLTPISFVIQGEIDEEGTTANLNRLESSFLYTNLFKHVLLNMNYKSDDRQAIVKCCREHYANNCITLKMIDDFDRDYQPNQAIRWFTGESFIYQMLNRALRLLESDVIMDLRFFIHDLHRQLEQIHEEQFSNYHGEPLVLYRSQALSIENFAKLQKAKGGFIAFNNFLSTSTLKSVVLDTTRQSALCDNMVGILFVITADPTIRSAVFANIGNEVVFSLHTVFHIDDVLKLDESQRLFEVRLMLMSEKAPEMRRLADRIEHSTGGTTGWNRLGNAILNLGQLRKAEELYQAFLLQKPSEFDQGLYYHQLGLIKHRQGDYKRAVDYYERAISIRENVLSPIDPALATSYNNIGLVYSNLGDYSRALFYYNKALSIREAVLPVNHPDLAFSYKNMGWVHSKMGDDSQALTYFNKVVTIREENHPDMGQSYNKIGRMHDSMGNYSEALASYSKALESREKTLPNTHLPLSTYFNNIGAVYSKLGDYSQALSNYKKALVIREKALPLNHPHLGNTYNSIGWIYSRIGDHSQALLYYQKALNIRQEALPINHPDLATSYNNIGAVYSKMGDYSEALSYYNRALAIRENTLSGNHPTLATFYSNIGWVYAKMRDHTQALLYYNKVVAILEDALPVNYIDLATSYNNIASVYDSMKENSQALSYYQKVAAIQEKSLPDNHPDLATSYNNIGMSYSKMRDNSQALSFYRKSLVIRERILPAHHADLATSYNNIGWVHSTIGDYSQALSHYTKALAILEKTLSSEDPHLAPFYNNIGGTYYKLKEYSKAQWYFQKVLEIRQSSLPSEHLDIQSAHKLLEIVNDRLQRGISRSSSFSLIEK